MVAWCHDHSRLVIITALEAQVAPEREADLIAAYDEASRETLPLGFVRSVLLHDSANVAQWRIETTWTSREALMAMRGKGTPRGLLIFRAAGAEPTLTILEVVAELPKSGDG